MGITVKSTVHGGKKVTAEIDGFKIDTDQSVASGGEASAPEPFDYFFASLSTCATLYAVNFCDSREIETTGLEVNLKIEKDPEKKLWSEMVFEVKLPTNFPDKYKKAILKAMNLCTVKKHISSEINVSMVLV
jgi:ribosomal protein S12 methylthiotransferase accessory factor